MNPIHQCIQKLSHKNHLLYVPDVRTYVRTKVMLYAPNRKWLGNNKKKGLLSTAYVDKALYQTRHIFALLCSPHFVCEGKSNKSNSRHIYNLA